MAVTTATLFTGSISSEVRLIHLDSSRAVFFGRRQLVEQFARLTFKVGPEWFDVEGVVTARQSSSAQCICTISFASMTAANSARLEVALRDRRSTTKLEAIKTARQKRESARAPISLRPRPGSAEAEAEPDQLEDLYRDALKDVA